MSVRSPLSPKTVPHLTHVLCPPSFFQNHDHRTHDCSSSPSLDQSQNPSAKPTCLASPPNVKKPPYMTVPSAFSGPYLKSTVGYAMCCFFLQNQEKGSGMTVPSTFSGSIQKAQWMKACAASFSKTRKSSIYGCLCLRLLWTYSKFQVRLLCAASSSKNCHNNQS